MLTRWKTGDKLAATHLDEVPAYLNDRQTYQDGGFGLTVPGLQNVPGATVAQIWIMTITNLGPTGQADTTDSTYWLKKQQCTNDFVSDGDENAEIALEDETLPDENPLIVNGTNLDEQGAETHMLVTDESLDVIVYAILARQDEDTQYPLVKYFFSVSSGQTLEVNLTVTSGTSTLAGDATTAAGFKYSPKDLAGNAIKDAMGVPLTDMVPTGNRPVGKTAVATQGQMSKVAGVWKLRWTDECPATLKQSC